jgi:hypothetical protein
MSSMEASLRVSEEKEAMMAEEMYAPPSIRYTHVMSCYVMLSYVMLCHIALL